MWKMKILHYDIEHKWDRIWIIIVMHYKASILIHCKLLCEILVWLRHQRSCQDLDNAESSTVLLVYYTSLLLLFPLSNNGTTLLIKFSSLLIRIIKPNYSSITRVNYQNNMAKLKLKLLLVHRKVLHAWNR